MAGLAAMAMVACGGLAPEGSGGGVASTQSSALDLRPNGRGGGLRHEAKGSHGGGGGGGGKTNNGIFYHGGPLVLGTTDAYYIWYGDWSGNSAPSILTDLANGLGGTPYFDINTTYSDGSGAHVSNAVAYGGSTTDSYSRGTRLGDSDIEGIVADALASHALPADPNGVYFVLTSADVQETSGFCSSYCGWHTYATLSGTTVKYAFVGDPDQCPSGCEAQSTASPNGNPGADGMASVISHELEEAVTDPQLDAWYDRRGEENADKCAWTFGATFTEANGSKANMSFGGRDWLIQQNWVNASGGYCAKSYAAPLAVR